MIAIVAPSFAVDFAAALEELAVVHRKEQAALLRAAARFACSNASRGRLFVAGPERSGRPSWRRACLEELELAAADGVEVHALLARLSSLPVRSWPRPSRIALAALELERCHAGVLDLARARIAEGRLAEGIGVLRDLLGEEPLGRDRKDALESMALAFEAAGRASESLAWYEAAISVPGIDVRVAVSMLSLALRHGDAARIGIAADRLRPLALSVPGARSRFSSALRQALARNAARGGSPSAGRDWIWQLALEGEGAEAEVARALLEDG
jgi:hypothetical protein